MSQWSPSFREDEVKAADQLGTCLAPKFFYLLTVYGVGCNLVPAFPLVGSALAALPVYAFYRGFGIAWRRWVIPALARVGLS